MNGPLRIVESKLNCCCSKGAPQQREGKLRVFLAARRWHNAEEPVPGRAIGLCLSKLDSPPSAGSAHLRLMKRNAFFLRALLDQGKPRIEVGMAIGVSQLRAINFSLAVSSNAWSLILKFDMVATTNCILHAAFQLVDNLGFYTQAVQFCLARVPLPATMGYPCSKRAWRLK
eukprot:104862-Alexandrium_andersonii.AAC.1